MKRLLSLAVVALLATTPAPVWAATGLTSVTGATVWPNADNQDHSLGWSFSTTGQTVYALGYNDFGFSSPHHVGLYDAGGTLLASATVTGTSTLLNGYRYTSLGSALTLGSGTYYLAGTTQGLNDGWIYEASSISTNAATTYLGSFYTSGTGGTLAFPTNSAPDREYLLTNFTTDPFGQAVPEPGTWVMMLLGFGMIGYALRRRPDHAAVMA